MRNIKELKEDIKDFKVLFVDDEEQIQKITGVFLKKFFHTVFVSKDGIDGLEIFKQNRDIDIIITDIKMPKMDGTKMVEEIKKIKPNIFTVFVTASRGGIEFNKELYDLYIKKPISFDDIVQIMESINAKLS